MSILYIDYKLKLYYNEGKNTTYQGVIMKTEVTMKRELFGHQISQKSKSEFFSATELVKAGIKWRIANGLSPFDMTQWLRTQSTKDFVSALENKYGKVKISGQGRGVNTWVHPLLFIDMALAISPDLKIEVYEWLFDHLLKYRNDSGDSYKKMSGAIFHKIQNKQNFSFYIREVADRIRHACKVEDWQSAPESVLKKRDRIHENIALLCDILPVEDSVRIGIQKEMVE